MSRISRAILTGLLAFVSIVGLAPGAQAEPARGSLLILDDSGTSTGCTLSVGLTHRQGTDSVRTRAGVSCEEGGLARLGQIIVVDLTTTEVMFSIRGNDFGFGQSVGWHSSIPCAGLGERTYLITARAMVRPTFPDPEPRHFGAAQRRITVTC